MLAPHGKKSEKCRESDEGGMLMDEWEIKYSFSSVILMKRKSYSNAICKNAKRREKVRPIYFLTQKGYYTVRANQKQKKAGPLERERH